MKCPHTFHLPKSEMKFHNNRILTQFSAQCTPKAAKWFVMKWYMSVAAQNSLRMTKQWPLTAYQSFVEIYVCICIVFMECSVSDVYPFNFNLEILSIHRYFVVNVALCICSLSLPPSVCVVMHNKPNNIVAPVWILSSAPVIFLWMRIWWPIVQAVEHDTAAVMTTSTLDTSQQ